jgi:alkanesulfonate monooxygenase SsuD/methylene tetrahydromethanopterin reductase-like flavin-dependent oxidoreductase (luciferase family)
MSSVSLLPLQHPVIMAKALSTADWLSNGRITATFGVGWDAEEFKVLGVPFHERGRMADEYLAAIVELWTSDSPEFEGKYVSFKYVTFEPKPIQKTASADLDRRRRRADAQTCGAVRVRLVPVADLPGRHSREDRLHQVPTHLRRKTVRGAVRPRHVTDRRRTQVVDDPTQQSGMSAEQIIDQLGWFSELGVTITGVPIPPVKDVNAYLDYAQWAIEEIKPQVP